MISNASPLIFFSKINKLDLLCTVFPQIIISREVFIEVVQRGESRPDAVLIEKYIKQGNIIINDLVLKYQTIASQLVARYTSLDRGEAETIALALQKKENEVLMDDSAGRKVAELNNLLPSGSLRVLLLAFQRALISKEDTLKIMKMLIDAGLYLGAEVVERFYEVLDTMGR